MSCSIENNAYVLTKTIVSKSQWCKTHGGKWNATRKAWMFPIDKFKDCKTLEMQYAKANYNTNSKAAYFKKQREAETRRKKQCDQIQKQLDDWIQNLRPGPTPDGNEMGILGGLSFMGYKTNPSYDALVLEASKMNNCFEKKLLRYGNGGVFVYRGRDD